MSRKAIFNARSPRISRPPRHNARVFAAEPCVNPARNGLGLLAGDGRRWPVLFANGDK
jgi:hypothetical protein